MLKDKPLSELLAEVEPSEFFNSEAWAKARHDLCVDGWPAAAVLINQESRKLYEQNQKLKAVAVELAKAIEYHHEVWGNAELYCMAECNTLCKSLNTARKMLGD